MKSYSIYLFLLAASVAVTVSGCSKSSSSETPVQPTVTAATLPVTLITQTTATFNGSLAVTGDVTPTERGFCYGTTANPTTSNTKVFNGSTVGSFKNSVLGLTANTLYHVRAFATTTLGTVYGDDITFTTLANVVVINLPTVTTNAATNITLNTATCGGNVTANGGADSTVRGVCYATTTLPTTANTLIQNGKGNGIFTSNLTNLTPNTTYYVRAYATNSKGTAYGNQIAFTTSSLTIGDTYQGGKIFYILKSGDVGYVAGQVHGLIAAESDLTSTKGFRWFNGKWNQYTPKTSYEIGCGLTNTENIIKYMISSGDYAAKMCYDLSSNGYDDWYLPSWYELKELYSNKYIFTNFTSGYYWSSTMGGDRTTAIATIFINTPYSISFEDIWNYYSVRPIRSF